MLDVVEHRGLLIIAGYEQGSGDADAALWVRRPSDGWFKVLPDGGDGAAGDQRINSVQGRGNKLIAVGTDNASGEWDAATWLSKDFGASWARTDSGLHLPGNDEMFSVADNGAQFVAVGYRSDSQGTADVAIWSSREGQQWALVSEATSLFANPGNAAARDVTAIGNGFVAAGREALSRFEREPDPAVWRSRNGKGWDSLESPYSARPHNQGIMSIVAWRNGFLAGGFDSGAGTFDAAIWRSLDGVTWDRIPDDESVFGGPENQVILAIAEESGLLIAAGVDGIKDGEDASVWLSLDGEEWRRLRPDEAVFGGDGRQTIRGVVVRGREIIAVGGTQESGDWDIRIWRGQVEAS